MRGLRRYAGLLGTYLRPQWRRVALLAALLLGSIALQLANPQVLRFFVDAALAGAPADTLARAALLFITIALVTQGLTTGAQYAGESVGWAATNALRGDLALHCLRLDLGFHKGRTAGELIERVDGDVSSLAGFFSRFVVNVLGNVVLLIGGLAVCWREDWRAGLALTGFATAALAVLGRLRGIAVPYWGRVREAAAQLYGFLGERLAGTEDLRANGATGYVMQGLLGHHRAWLHARRRANAALAALSSSTILTFAAGSAVALGVGGYLWSTGAITVGTVLLLFSYAQLLRFPIEQLRRELQEMQRAVAGFGRVDALLAARPRVADGRGGALPDGPLGVEFDAVRFAYQDDPAPPAGAAPAPGEPAPGQLVLRDVSFSLAPGRTLGLLGRTGSGKSTIARLLLRLYDPTAGTVSVGGRSLRDCALDEVRRRVTMVTQDVQLFAATARDNLTFFDPSVPDRRLAGVLGEVGLEGWLRALPAGLDTMLGTGGRGLSAGEAQLFAFARVLLRDPGVVVLDEASSRLDPATEGQVQRAVRRLLAGRTAIVIAHRLATVQRVDDVLILAGGRVAEWGSRAALADDPGSRFARLLRTGLADVPREDVLR